MQSLLTWSPATIEIKEKGKQIEKAVDFQGSYTIHFDGSKFHILNIKTDNVCIVSPKVSDFYKLSPQKVDKYCLGI